MIIEAFEQAGTTARASEGIRRAKRQRQELVLQNPNTIFPSMENNDMTYGEALAELERILASLRGDSCDIDTLAERTARAAELLKYCRARLTRTEDELAKVLDELDGQTEQ